MSHFELKKFGTKDNAGNALDIKTITFDWEKNDYLMFLQVTQAPGPPEQNDNSLVYTMWNGKKGEVEGAFKNRKGEVIKDLVLAEGQFIQIAREA